MRKCGSIVCRLRPCLPKGPTNSARMRTIVTAALQRNICKWNLFSGYALYVGRQPTHFILPNVVLSMESFFCFQLKFQRVVIPVTYFCTLYIWKSIVMMKKKF
jgi:hypothetical protein